MAIWVNVWFSLRPEQDKTLFLLPWESMSTSPLVSFLSMQVSDARTITVRGEGSWNHTWPGAVKLRLGNWVEGVPLIWGPLPTSQLELEIFSARGLCQHEENQFSLCCTPRQPDAIYSLPLPLLASHLQAFECPLVMGIGDLTSSSLSLPLPSLLHFLLWHLRGASILVCHSYNLWKSSPPDLLLHFTPPSLVRILSRVPPYFAPDVRGYKPAALAFTSSFILLAACLLVTLPTTPHPHPGVCVLTSTCSQINWLHRNPLKGERIKQFSSRCGLNCLVLEVSKGQKWKVPPPPPLSQIWACLRLGNLE